MTPKVKIKNLGLCDYESTWHAMRQFTDERDKNTPDEIWLLQHNPVFTLGQAGKPEHIINPKDIPVFQSDRGGQVTYHGPGQLVAYLLLDIKRLNSGPRAIVTSIENSLIGTLKNYNIEAFAKSEAPGVYVATNKANDAKIGALGLRIRKSCTYHGLSLNIDMDLGPFSYINPCGYENQAVCQLADFIEKPKIDLVAGLLLQNLQNELNIELGDN